MTKATNKAATIVNAAAVAAPAAVIVAAPAAAPTKADKARAIFNAAYALPVVPARKDIIASMIADAGLTKAGAATYLQNFKNKAGLVVKKAPAAPAVATA